MRTIIRTKFESMRMQKRTKRSTRIKIKMATNMKTRIKENDKTIKPKIRSGIRIKKRRMETQMKR